jgi:hypothetical protein
VPVPTKKRDGTVSKQNVLKKCAQEDEGACHRVKEGTHFYTFTVGLLLVFFGAFLSSKGMGIDNPM